MSAAGFRGRGTRRAALAAIAATWLGATAAGVVGGPRAAADVPLSPTSTAPSCPTSNPPNELVLTGGTPQSAQLGAAFATALAVALANTDGCPLSPTPVGTAITFTAPASGASAVFPETGGHAVTVGSDPSGLASTIVIAGTTPGSYTILATSAYGAVSFALADTAAGVPARLAPVGPVDETTPVGKAYPQRLSVRVFDASGAPVGGVAITFSLDSSPPDGPGASFSSGNAQATVTTNSLGLAVSPRLRADHVAGTVTATATLAGTTAGGSAGATSALVTGVDFQLHARAGAPATVTAGAAAASQSTTVERRFPIPLAVTVTDADGNPVPDTPVTFAAPAHGASGSFAAEALAVGGRTTRRRAASVRVIRVDTNRAGIAVAPALRADDRPGGYVVTAAAGHARPAAFALVNTPPGAPA
jgi:hypothetical protein